MDKVDKDIKDIAKNLAVKNIIKNASNDKWAGIFGHVSKCNIL